MAACRHFRPLEAVPRTKPAECQHWWGGRWLVRWNRAIPPGTRMMTTTEHVMVGYSFVWCEVLHVLRSLLSSPPTGRWITRLYNTDRFASECVAESVDISPVSIFTQTIPRWSIINMTLYEVLTAAPGGGTAGCVLCAVGLLLGALYSTRGRAKPRVRDGYWFTKQTNNCYDAHCS